VEERADAELTMFPGSRSPAASSCCCA